MSQMGHRGRELALGPLDSALLYYLMPSNSVCEDRNLYPGIGPREHNSLVSRYRLLLKHLPDHSHK